LICFQKNELRELGARQRWPADLQIIDKAAKIHIFEIEFISSLEKFLSRTAKGTGP